jgi:hypothetical protein
MKHQEYILQKAVCKFLETNYPNALFLSDTIGNVKLTESQAYRNKQIQKKDFKCTDLLILEPNRLWNGLFIELKIKSPYKQNGQLYKNEHLQAQEKSINDLIQKGYFACFKWDFEDVKKLINSYMKDK